MNLLDFDFTALSNGTVVGAIGGSGTTWYCTDNSQLIPGSVKVDNAVTIGTAGGLGAMAGAGIPSTATAQAEYVPTLTLTTSYQLTANVIPKGAFAGGGTTYSVGVFLGADAVAHSSGIGVTVLAYTDQMQIFDQSVSASEPIATLPFGSSLAAGVAYDLAVVVTGDNISASINGYTLSVSFTANPSYQGIGFVVGRSTVAPSGVRNFTIATLPQYFGLQVGNFTPPRFVLIEVG